MVLVGSWALLDIYRVFFNCIAFPLYFEAQFFDLRGPLFPYDPYAHYLVCLMVQLALSQGNHDNANILKLY